MTADINIDINAISRSTYSVGDTVTEAMLASVNDGASDLNSITGTMTLEFDEELQENYLNVPAGQQVQIIGYNSATTGGLTYCAVCADLRVHQVGFGTNGWNQSGSERLLSIVDGGSTRLIAGPRAITVDGVDFLRVGDTAYPSNRSYWDDQYTPRQTDYESIDTRWRYGHGMVRAESGGIGVYHNGYLISGGDLDTRTPQYGVVGRIVVQSKTYRDMRIYGRIKFWNTDFRDEPEFKNIDVANKYASTWRMAYGQALGAFAFTGTANRASTEYATSGGVLRRQRTILTGSSGDTAVFTLRSSHAFSSPQEYNGRSTYRSPCIVAEGGGVCIATIGNTSAGNPARVRMNGGAGSSGSDRRLEIDPGTGTFAAALDKDGDAIVYNDAHRFELIIILDDRGGSVILHDLTENGETTRRVQAASLGYTGTRSPIDNVVFDFTLGTGDCEFEGVYQPPQLQYCGVSSYVSYNLTSNGIVMTANAHLARELDYYPDFVRDPDFVFDACNPWGRSGHELTDWDSEIGWALNAEHLRESRFAPLEIQANDSHDPSLVNPALTTTLRVAMRNEIEIWGMTHVPVDNTPTTEQDDARVINAHLKGELARLNFRAGGFRLSDPASQYTDAQALGLSDDGVHLTTEGDAEVMAYAVANIQLTPYHPGDEAPLNRRLDVGTQIVEASSVLARRVALFGSGLCAQTDQGLGGTIPTTVSGIPITGLLLHMSSQGAVGVYYDEPSVTNVTQTQREAATQDSDAGATWASDSSQDDHLGRSLEIAFGANIAADTAVVRSGILAAAFDDIDLNGDWAFRFLHRMSASDHVTTLREQGAITPGVAQAWADLAVETAAGVQIAEATNTKAGFSLTRRDTLIGAGGDDESGLYLEILGNVALEISGGTPVGHGLGFFPVFQEGYTAHDLLTRISDDAISALFEAMGGATELWIEPGHGEEASGTKAANTLALAQRLVKLNNALGLTELTTDNVLIVIPYRAPGSDFDRIDVNNLDSMAAEHGFKTINLYATYDGLSPSVKGEGLDGTSRTYTLASGEILPGNADTGGYLAEDVLEHFNRATPTYGF